MKRLINSAKEKQVRFRVFQGVQQFVLALLLCLATANAMASGDKVNLNQADATVLQYIPGIGAARAADIVSLREQNGGFKHYEELLDVSGIGEKILDSIKQYGTLEGGVSELTQEMIDNPPKTTTQD